MSNSRAAQLVEAGMWLRLSGDHEGARRLFEQALRLEPDNARARQLLESGPNTPAEAPPAAPPAPAAPAAEYPFAPPAVSTPMDLDWGSATGFAPTPVPFIPPVSLAPPVPVAPPAPLVIEELPPEVEIVDHPVALGDDAPTSTLVFGLKGGPVPDPAPTVPEPWADAPASSATMSFQQSSGEEVPWSVPAPAAPATGTMQFARPGGPGGSGTMQFARPAEPTGTGTMQFARPAAPPPDEAAPAFGTMLFAKPSDLAAAAPVDPEPAFGTMLFAQPSQPTAAPPVAPPGGTMEFARPSAMPLPEPPRASPAAPMMSPSPMPDIPEGEWDAISSPSAIFELPMINPLPVKPAGAVNPYDLMAPGPPPSEPKFAPNATSAWDQRSNPGIKISDIAPGLGAALDLVAADRPPVSSPSGIHKLAEVKTLIRGAKDLLGLDDHTGAMDLILKAQELAPNDAEVQAMRERSERTLEAMFESKLGKLSAAPRVKLKDDEIIWLNLDHRAGFVLAQIDGQVTFDDLFSVSGMSRLDTARILAQLIEEGVIIA